ncbi:CHRD domain-containing protein [Micromonospora coriariae]|uniref:CHRD domain-containing protein n=1 Tax=Micromonospora coriariae TaxID=285665 RepID=A0A1C4XVM6_9ACTN|nr:CHRD domain-containing protein [Micromonospora coriariae]SCF12525.1 CHRD domain-containing protein [Micromonospora coriariae]
MRRTRLWAVAMAASAAVTASAIGTAAMGDGRDDSGDKRESHDSRDSRDWSDSRDRKEVNVRAKLSGFEEDPKTISTPGSGRFEATINERDKTIEFELSYEDLKDVQQAHIHFGGKHQSGGIAVFLCSNLKDAKGGPSHDVQSCPEAPATIKGTIKPDDVVGPADQGIEPGEFDELVDAIEAGVTYVNVHTKKYPNGEIRGQIKSDDEKDQNRDDENRDSWWSDNEDQDSWWSDDKDQDSWWSDHEDRDQDKRHDDKGHENQNNGHDNEDDRSNDEK